MTKICLNCNEEYDDSYKFCQNCGTELSEVKGEEKNEKGFFTKVIEKGTELKEKNDAYYEEKRKKKKLANRTTTEKEYDFYFEDIVQQFKEDAKKADKVYRAYVTSGISRLEKINGRFLASQLIKLDILNKQNKRIIEQNDAIIDLLTQLVNK
ncbi:zinc ribbon domain-containing protein [uncultured Methanobrevibacter sp.]|uniref:zinc ribbon domain-containing protein n=1 Tax=uncultured Methanobrevibacter sp. TaxID=253161 RepID=UPI002603C7B6|nr:zinc ribbon domain-containing protein [uncultured Methanobrevibacter sp.]